MPMPMCPPHCSFSAPQPTHPPTQQTLLAACPPAKQPPTWEATAFCGDGGAASAAAAAASMPAAICCDCCSTALTSRFRASRARASHCTAAKACKACALGALPPCSEQLGVLTNCIRRREATYPHRAEVHSSRQPTVPNAYQVLAPQPHLPISRPPWQAHLQCVRAALQRAIQRRPQLQRHYRCPQLRHALLYTCQAALQPRADLQAGEEAGGEADCEALGRTAISNSRVRRNPGLVGGNPGLREM